jgi:hypothetical protein
LKRLATQLLDAVEVLHEQKVEHSTLVVRKWTLRHDRYTRWAGCERRPPILAPDAPSRMRPRNNRYGTRPPLGVVGEPGALAR